MSVLELKSVSKTFGAKAAVSTLSLSLKSGEIYGFLGPNGAGKTTTIRMIMGFIAPTSGDISLLGAPLRFGESVSRHVGYLSSDTTLYGNWTGAEHIRYVSAMRGGAPDSQRLVEQFQLDTSVRVSRLSTGNKQKLALVLALMHRPKLLVLDEPTRGLDPMLQNEVASILTDFREQGGTVFMSSHDLTEVERLCDRVGIIKAGRLVASERIESLPNFQVHEATVTFGHAVDPEQFKLAGVTVHKTTETTIVFRIEGAVGPFLKRLSTLPIADIVITHLSLEELFMSYYQ